MEKSVLQYSGVLCANAFVLNLDLQPADHAYPAWEAGET